MNKFVLLAISLVAALSAIFLVQTMGGESEPLVKSPADLRPRVPYEANYTIVISIEADSVGFKIDGWTLTGSKGNTSYSEGKFYMSLFGVRGVVDVYSVLNNTKSLTAVCAEARGRGRECKRFEYAWDPSRILASEKLELEKLGKCKVGDMAGFKYKIYGNLSGEDVLEAISPMGIGRIPGNFANLTTSTNAVMCVNKDLIPLSSNVTVTTSMKVMGRTLSFKVSILTKIVELGTYDEDRYRRIERRILSTPYGVPIASPSETAKT